MKSIQVFISPFFIEKEKLLFKKTKPGPAVFKEDLLLGQKA